MLSRRLKKTIEQSSEYASEERTDVNYFHKKAEQEIERYQLQSNGQPSIDVREGDNAKNIISSLDIALRKEAVKRRQHDMGYDPADRPSNDLLGSVEYYQRNKARSFTGHGDGTEDQQFQQEQHLESTSDALKLECEQYNAKAEKHGKTSFYFDSTWENIRSNVLNMPSERELRKIVDDYKCGEDDSDDAGYEMWDENTISSKFAPLREKLNYVEKESYLEPFIRHGKELKILDDYFKSSDLKARIEKHNTYSHNKIDMIHIENWEDISNRIYSELAEGSEE